MFSQVFNKAKGIFSKRDLPASASEDSSVTAHASHSDSAESEDKSTDTITEDMVTTRQGHVANAAVNGKRRNQNTNGQSTKRRRISAEHEDGLIEELSSQQQVPEDKVAVEILGTKKRRVSNGVGSTSAPDKAGNHVRFGSEEPALPIRTAREVELPEPPAPKEIKDSEDEDEDEDEDDDDAPEVVVNSAQLLSLKVQAQKQKEAKKRYVIILALGLKFTNYWQ
jgi:U3 small nucleolar RNA-associated protein 16